MQKCSNRPAELRYPPDKCLLSFSKVVYAFGMTDAERTESGIGAYLRELRGARSLRAVYRQTGISDPYLSNIEKGHRRPGPRVLQKLAAFYGVSLHDLLKRAGHLDDDADAGSDEEANVDRAFDFVIADPKFRFGTRPEGPLSLAAKRFIVEMYETLTGKRLLE